MNRRKALNKEFLSTTKPRIQLSELQAEKKSMFE